MQELIEKYYRAFNERRFADNAELFASDAEIQHRPTGTPLVGPEGYLTSASMAIASFPDLRLEVVGMKQRGDTVVEIDLLATGTHEGDWTAREMGTIKATGRPKTFRLRETLEVRAGKITFSSLNYNLQDMLS